MSGFVVHYLLIRYSRDVMGIDVSSSILFSELGKLAFCIAWFSVKHKTFLPLDIWRRKSYRGGMLFAIPAILYAVYNQLTFINLGNFDTSTFQVLMQSRVLFTGILFVVILKQRLNMWRWISLMILTAGMSIKHVRWPLDFSAYSNPFIGLLFLQAAVSSFSAVYSEYLLKDIKMDFFEQGFFLYSFGFVVNFLYVALFGIPLEFFAHWSFVLLVLNGIMIGVLTGLVLKYLDSVVKNFASAVEVFLTVIAGHVFLGDPLGPLDFISCCIVACAIALYRFMSD